MPMHPAVTTYDLYPVLELLFTKEKIQALEKLASLGFINDTTRPRWEDEFKKGQYETNFGDLLATAKLMIDPKASLEGKLSSKDPLAILSNLLSMMDLARQFGCDYSLGSASNQTIMDYGAGIYNTLSAATLLFANGYKKVISYEPFELEIDFVVSSMFELIKAVFESPSQFCFSGISAENLKSNLAKLNFENIQAKLIKFNRHEIDFLDLGDLVLTNKAETIADSSVDIMFSNSVLEHVSDLNLELAWHRRILNAKGLCFHTVDFVDHRYYFDRNLNIMEMYYDGVLDEINGLRPSQMEAIFLVSGFACYKFQRLSIPEALVDTGRQLLPPFSELPKDDMFEWVNGYLLQKN